MSQIFTGISDWDLDKEFIQNIKDRSIDQKFLYLEDGATNYYNYYEAVKKRVGLLQDVFTDEDYFTFWQKNIYTHQTKEAYIALACGQAKIDLAVVNKISSKVDDYTLLGVDSSYSMLESARNNYFESESAFQAKFLCIDFSRIDFPEKIESYTDPFDKKVFSLL
ncbi:MAG: class I SAM-dependent methyltransferase [Patescibacteria group bacterium]|nr:class I SAM-dependent methyltransferase [Patescibacteria group bacterium]